jgi:hypothetical protein
MVIPFEVVSSKYVDDKYTASLFLNYSVLTTLPKMIEYIILQYEEKQIVICVNKQIVCVPPHKKCVIKLSQNLANLIVQEDLDDIHSQEVNNLPVYVPNVIVNGSINPEIKFCKYVEVDSSTPEDVTPNLIQREFIKYKCINQDQVVDDHVRIKKIKVLKTLKDDKDIDSLKELDDITENCNFGLSYNIDCYIKVI